VLDVLLQRHDAAHGRIKGRPLHRHAVADPDPRRATAADQAPTEERGESRAVAQRDDELAERQLGDNFGVLFGSLFGHGTPAV
jgi:hypothetical protein